MCYRQCDLEALHFTPVTMAESPYETIRDGVALWGERVHALEYEGYYDFHWPKKMALPRFIIRPARKLILVTPKDTRRMFRAFWSESYEPERLWLLRAGFTEFVDTH